MASIALAGGPQSPPSSQSWPCTSFRSCWEQIHLLSIDTSLLAELAPWIQHGTRKFRPFTQKSYEDLEKAGRHVEIGLKFPEGQENVDQRRRHLALGISQIIHLDAVQTYVLLHKYEAHSSSVRPSASKIAPSPSGTKANGGTDDSDLVFKVCEFYFQERQALLECVLEVLRNELRDEPDVKSLQIRDVVGRMDESLVERSLSTLNASVSYFPSHHFVPSYESSREDAHGCLGRCPNETHQAGLQKYWTEQQTLEQLLLMQQIFLFYYQEENIPTREGLARLVDFICEMHTDTFGSALSTVATKNVTSTLSTSIFAFIEMLDVDGLLELLATGAAGGQGGGDKAAADLSKWDKLNLTMADVERIAQPHFTLAWSVSQQLKRVLNPLHSGKGDLSPDQIAAGAISQGGLGRLLFALKEEVIGQSVDATAFHSVLKNFCSALLVAFELNPRRLGQDLLDVLTQILSHVLSGEPALVEQFWEEEYILDQPLRNFLGECQQLFPTLPIPYMRLLQALCEAVDDSNANLINDQVLAHFRDLRSVSVFHFPGDLMDAASEMHIRHQVLERLPLVIGRRVRIVKNAMCQLPECLGLFVDDKVVGNVLEFYQNARDPSESKFLVSWMVEIDGYFLILSRLHAFSLSEDKEMIAKSGEIQLIFRLLSSVLANSLNHWEELMAVRIEDNEIRLLDAAARIFQRYRALLSHASRKEDAEVCLSVLSSCLNLAVAVSTCDPTLIGEWLRNVVGTGAVAGSSITDPSECIPTVADIYRSEVAKGNFDFTVTFLKLANSLIEKAVFGPESVLYLYFGTFGVLSNIQNMTFLAAHQRLDLVSAALNLIQNSIRVYELLLDARHVQADCPFGDFDWTQTGFTRDMEAFLLNKFTVSIAARASVLLSESSLTEAMHMRGQNLLASNMEMSVQTAGKLILRLLSLTERVDLSQDLFSCIVSNFGPNGLDSLTRVVTSYCEYQFDLEVRRLSFDVLRGTVSLASRLDNVSLLQCCYPYSLTSAKSSKFLRILASSLAEESLLGSPDLFSSVVQFLTCLVHFKFPFPPVIIPGYDPAKENDVLSLWIRYLSQCLVNDECRTKQPSAYSLLMEFLDCAWVLGLSFITQGILENSASWARIEELAASPQQWNSLSAAWTFKFADFGQDYFCRVHAGALNILAHELFLCSRGLGADEERAASLRRWVDSNIFGVISEFARIRIDVSTRLRLQAKLKSLLMETSSVSNVFSHLGIRSILRYAEESAPKSFERRDSSYEDFSTMQREELNQNLQSAFPIEHLFLCCLDSEQPLRPMWLKDYRPLDADKFAVDYSILSQDYVVAQKVEAIQSLVKKINAQSQVESAAISLARAVSSITFLVKDRKGPGAGGGLDQVDLPKFLGVAVESLNWSLEQLTNYDVSKTRFATSNPIEQVVLAFNKALVQVCSTGLTIGLDNDLLEDEWMQSVFYVKGETTEWMHNWLTFLANSPQGKQAGGVEMSVKILGLLHKVYANLDEAAGGAGMGMETILKSFALSCSFCHTTKELKLSSLLVIKCLMDDWLSPKMSHGDWVPLLAQSPAKSELCRLGEESYPSELRSMLLVTAAAIAETGAGARTLIDWWKEHGTFRQLIKYAAFLVSETSAKSSAEWCTYLELVGTLLYVCSDLTSSTDGIAALCIFAFAMADELHPFIVNLLSTFGNNDRLLQTSELVVVKHVAFLLYALCKFAKRWNLQLPRTMANVQDSVVVFLVYAAQPALKPYFLAESRASGEREARLLEEADDFGSANLEGWFGAVRSVMDPEGQMGKGMAQRESAMLMADGGSKPEAKKPALRGGNGSEKRRSQHSFQVAHTMYTNVCYFLEFLLISLPSSEPLLVSADTFTESLVISLIGIQIQSIHISAGLCNDATSRGASGLGRTSRGDLLKIFSRILNLTTFVQEAVFRRSNLMGSDKHGRNSWRLMSNLTAAYVLLKQSIEGYLTKVDEAQADAGVREAMAKTRDTLRAGGERWAGILSSDEALLAHPQTCGPR